TRRAVANSRGGGRRPPHRRTILRVAARRFAIAGDRARRPCARSRARRVYSPVLDTAGGMQRANPMFPRRRPGVDPAARRLIAVAAVGAGLAIAAACGQPGHAAGPGTGAPGTGVHDFPPVPSGETPPPLDEIAAMLASGLPEADRAAARPLLVDDILSRDLRDLPSAPSAQPSARAIV